MQLCALHAVNSVLPPGEPRFAKADFDAICEALSPARFFNPHRAWCGTGYYDVNVIMCALEKRGYDVSWFDSRRPVSEIPPSASVAGFILNCAYRGWAWLFLRDKRHWFAVRNADGTVYNLDSKLRRPEVRPGPRISATWAAHCAPAPHGAGAGLGGRVSRLGAPRHGARWPRAGGAGPPVTPPRGPAASWGGRGHRQPTPRPRCRSSGCFRPAPRPRA